MGHSGDSMQRPPSATYQRRLIFILGLTFGVVFFDRNAVSFLAPLMQDELGLNFTQIGLLSSGLSLTWALAGMFGGAISDRTGSRKTPLLVAIVAFSLCSFISGLAVSFATLLVARLLMGIAEGPILPISQSLVAEQSATERRGHNMGVMQNVGSALLGSFAAPLVLIALARTFGWREAFYLAGVPGLVMAWLIWRYVHERAPDAGAAVLVRAAAAANAPVSVFGLFGYRNMVLCMLISIVMVTWMILGWVFLPQYYTQVRGMDPSEMSWQVSVLGLSAASSAFIVPRLSDRYGRRPIVLLFCLVGLIVPLAAMHFHGPDYLLATLVFLGWFAAGTFPIFMGTIPS